MMEGCDGWIITDNTGGDKVVFPGYKINIDIVRTIFLAVKCHCLVLNILLREGVKNIQVGGVGVLHFFWGTDHLRPFLGKCLGGKGSRLAFSSTLGVVK